MPNLRVKVTAEDIAEAEQSASMKCVVAQAIRRTFPGATKVDVDIQTIRWSQDGERIVYMTPYSVQGYIVAFDAGDTIQPFGFGLHHSSRIPAVRQRTKTPAGKAIDNKRTTARQAAAKRVKVEQASKVEQATARQVEEARNAEEQAVADLAAVKAAYAGEVKNAERNGGRAAPPRIVKSTTRKHGIKALRINQPAKPAGTVYKGPLDDPT